MTFRLFKSNEPIGNSYFIKFFGNHVLSNIVTTFFVTLIPLSYRYVGLWV